MTRIFVDANILVAVLNKEYPLFSTAARVLSLTDHPKFEVYTSATCLAIAFYFCSKKCGDKEAGRRIRLLSSKLLTAPTGQAEIEAVIRQPEIADFEDGIQYFAALHAGCSFIITEDGHDFWFSGIPVLNSDTFLRTVVVPML